MGGLNKVCDGTCLGLKLLGGVKVLLERREWFAACVGSVSLGDYVICTKGALVDHG